MCSWNPPKSKELPKFSNAAFQKKDGPSPTEKCHFLLEMDFLLKEMTNLASKFYKKKAVLIIYRMMPRMLES